MDMSTFRPGQALCVRTLDAPVVVSAGAGSGKTFTLTQRIAWALSQGSAPDGGAYLDDISQVLAITFTDKAAGEIKSRVKSTLRSVGLAEQALKVDDAWISTIHGMCSRILHTHAVELGLDPAFGVLGEADAAALLDQAVEDVLGGATEFVMPDGLDALFAEYAPRSAGFGSDSVEGMVRALVARAGASPEGFDCIEMPPATQAPSVLARELVSFVETLIAVVETVKQSDARDAWLMGASEFVEYAQGVLARGQVDEAALLNMADAAPWPTGKFGTKEYKERAKEAQAEMALLVQEIRFAFARPLLESVVELARRVHVSYEAQKTQCSMLDNDDLLVLASKAFARHPNLAQRYEHAFKLIMVDEFQDTDQLQIDMIKRMAGPGASALCTVGDAQQSIYRFRGADVSVYRRHLEQVLQENPSGVIELPDNFRSHADILSFVDRIFEKPEVFGDSFMSLSPASPKAGQEFKGTAPRVQVLVSTYAQRQGVSSADMVRVDARRMARAFAELHEAGNSLGEMALLLGRMTNAGVYAQALRDEGLSCVITGGSIFSSAPEVAVVARLVEVIANPHATAALFELLSSDMFALSADDLIEISTKYDEEHAAYVRRGLDGGFAALACAMQEGAVLSPSLAHAVRIVTGLADAAARYPVSEIVANAVRESGWLARLEASGVEGCSVAANIFKAIRLCENFEAQGAQGPAAVFGMMKAHFAAAKDSPGVLSAKGGNSVRIMTVHASKGLEFGIVGVAEMERPAHAGGAFSCESIDGRAYVSLAPGRSVSRCEASSPLKKCVASQFRALVAEECGVSAESVRSAATPAARAEAVRAYTEEQEAEERKRLMYVALTRAAGALIVSMVCPLLKGSPDCAAEGVYGDVRRALFGEGGFPEGESAAGYKGSAPARVSRVDITQETLAQWVGATPAAQQRGGENTFSIPAALAHAPLDLKPLRKMRSNMTSYSALAEEEALALPCAPVEFFDEDDAFWDALGKSLAADADKATEMGTAFHLLAQRAVAMRAQDALFEVPDDACIARVARQNGLGASSHSRLRGAFERWAASGTARRVCEQPVVCAELPFAVPLEVEPGAASVCLEGSIDLFAAPCMPGSCEALSQAALIVDYKTGGSAQEVLDQVREKHELQASCYAYAVLKGGFSHVEAVFVRVEQEDEACAGQPQCVSYRFSQEDMPRLVARIASAYNHAS